LIDFEVGQPLTVTVSTNTGLVIHNGEYVGSDECELILNENLHTPWEGWVYISREKIVEIKKQTPQAPASGTYFNPVFEKASI
jgi:hypothetical protein